MPMLKMMLMKTNVATVMRSYYTNDNFQIIGQAKASFHLGVLESVYIKTQNPVLFRQKEFVFSLKLFN